jgi:hypothetical protein
MHHDLCFIDVLSPVTFLYSLVATVSLIVDKDDSVIDCRSLQHLCILFFKLTTSCIVKAFSCYLRLYKVRLSTILHSIIVSDSTG